MSNIHGGVINDAGEVVTGQERVKILKQAREDAFGLVKNDPDLRLSDNMLIKKHIQQNYSHRIGLIKIG